MSKRSLFNIFGIIIVLLIAGFLIFFIYIELKEKKAETLKESAEEKRMEIILESLTAFNEGREISKEVLESLTAPNEGREIPKEVLDSLTPPGK